MYIFEYYFVVFLHLGLVRLTCEVITGDMDVTAL